MSPTLQQRGNTQKRVRGSTNIMTIRLTRLTTQSLNKMSRRPVAPADVAEPMRKLWDENRPETPARERVTWR